MSNHPRIPHSARWWALGVAAAIALACSSPGTDDSSSDGGEEGAADDGGG